MIVTIDVMLLKVCYQLSNLIFFIYRNENNSSGKKIVFKNWIYPPHSCFFNIKLRYVAIFPSFLKHFTFPDYAKDTRPLIINSWRRLQMMAKFMGSLL